MKILGLDPGLIQTGFGIINVIDNDYKKAKQISLFSVALYLCLIVCIHGSLIHINALSSSLNLIAISMLHIHNKSKNIGLTFFIAAISASLVQNHNFLSVPMCKRFHRKFVCRK